MSLDVGWKHEETQMLDGMGVNPSPTPKTTLGAFLLRLDHNTSCHSRLNMRRVPSFFDLEGSILAALEENPLRWVPDGTMESNGTHLNQSVARPSSSGVASFPTANATAERWFQHFEISD